MATEVEKTIERVLTEELRRVGMSIYDGVLHGNWANLRMDELAHEIARALLNK